MKRYTTNIGLLVYLALISFFSSAQVTKSDINKAIDIPSLHHPYLYFTESEKPALLDRIQNDQESNDIFRKLKTDLYSWKVKKGIWLLSH